MSERKVTVDGIEFKLGNTRYQYNGDALDAFRYRTVLAYFDPEHPEYLAVTDKGGRTSHFVTRIAGVGFAAAISDDESARTRYQEAVAEQKAQISLVRARYSSVHATFQQTFRKNITDRNTAALGREMLEKRQEAVAEQSQDDNRRNRNVKLARRVGVDVATVDLESPETEEALRRRADRRQSLENEQAADPEST